MLASIALHSHETLPYHAEGLREASQARVLSRVLVRWIVLTPHSQTGKQTNSERTQHRCLCPASTQVSRTKTSDNRKRGLVVDASLTTCSIPRCCEIFKKSRVPSPESISRMMSTLLLSVNRLDDLRSATWLVTLLFHTVRLHCAYCILPLCLFEVRPSDSYLLESPLSTEIQHDRPRPRQ